MSSITTSPAKTYTHTHPTLGPLTGLSLHPKLPPLRITDNDQNTIVQFRSIPYATIPARFAQSTLISCIPSTRHPLSIDRRPPRDFTTYGAACPSIPQPRSSYGGTLPGEPDSHLYDEWTCCNLTIAVPRACLQEPDRRVPVMVYIHGGGLLEGAGHVDGLHDNARLCALSVHEGLPVIVVNVGYRLNWLGFLACGDLVEETRLDGQGDSRGLDGGGAEGVFNVGLYDQRRAFQWVQENIAGFGGDPDNVTAFGESAGSISQMYHLSAEKPLFRRAILQSGSPFGTHGMEEKDREYQRLLTALGFAGSSAKERLEMLRKVDAERLTRVESLQSLFPYFGPGTEEMFKVGRAPDYANAAQLVRQCPWLEDVIVGDVQFEGHVFARFFREVEPKGFTTHVRGVFGDRLAQKLLDLYDIDPNGDMDGNLFWQNALLLLGDAFLSEPIDMLADTLAGSTCVQRVPRGEEGKGERRERKVYRYTLSLTNPIPGSEWSYVVGHHGVDCHFQFLNVLERYPRRRDNFFARQAIEMARRWIAFANGKEPWVEYVPPKQGGEGVIAVCDDIRGWEERTRDEDIKIGQSNPWGDRRYECWATIRSVFEQVKDTAKDPQSAQEKVNWAHKELLNLRAYVM